MIQAAVFHHELELIPLDDGNGRRAATELGRRWFQRKEYVGLFPVLSTATASRDLRFGLEGTVLEARGSRRLTQYRFRKRG